ncbi:MAG: DUF2510 domain-containing protein, partial [Pseudonocardia sp.]|nr:DUF2510 domain-containing protein [Pseudonocardia sp.]
GRTPPRHVIQRHPDSVLDEAGNRGSLAGLNEPTHVIYGGNRQRDGDFPSIRHTNHHTAPDSAQNMQALDLQREVLGPSDPPPVGPPAGWYPDGQGQQRWWNGSRWTEHTQPAR